LESRTTVAFSRKLSFIASEQRCVYSQLFDHESGTTMFKNEVTLRKELAKRYFPVLSEQSAEEQNQFAERKACAEVAEEKNIWEGCSDEEFLILTSHLGSIPQASFTKYEQIRDKAIEKVKLNLKLRLS
jgi:hypothetical protein